MHRDGDIRIINRMYKHLGCDCLRIFLAQVTGYCHKMGRFYFDVRTVQFVQYTKQINKCTTLCINNILYTVNTATSFDTSASSAGSLNYVLC